MSRSTTRAPKMSRTTTKQYLPPGRPVTTTTALPPVCARHVAGSDQSFIPQGAR